LLDTGVLRLAGGILGGGDVDVINPSDPNGPDSGPTELPTQPSNLVATGGFDIVFLDWDLPPYNGHNYVEIFRYASDDIVAAEAAGAYTRYYGDTYFYTDTNVGSSETWYYWVRAVNVDGITGPFNSSTGKSATTALDYEFIAGLIDDSLSDAGQALGLNDTINALENDISTVETSVAGLTSTVTTLNTTVSGNSTSIQTNATSISGIEGKYSVKIDNNGHVSGFGLISTNNNGAIVSSFIVAADRFAIARPTWSTDTNISTDFPFKVITSNTQINGASVLKGVYIDDAFIHNAQITTAKIENLAVTDAKIEDLTATKITSGNIQITAANDIKIYQGKTIFNSNQSGFWLGLNNNAGSFHIGSSGTKYLKFDGNLGDLEASGLEIKASDGTVLVDAGGFRTGSGGELAYNSKFNENADGWTSYQGSPFISAGVAYCPTNSYFRQTTQRFPVVKGEKLYVYAVGNPNGTANTGMSLGATFYASSDPTVTSSSGGTVFASGNGSGPSQLNVQLDSNISQYFAIGEITVPNNSNAKFAEMRFGNLNQSGNVSYLSVGISRTPPQIAPNYASTYIRNLSVDTLQIAGNAVTVPLGDSNDPDSAFSSSFIQSEGAMNVPAYNNSAWKDGVSVGPLSWTSTALRPEAVTVTAVVSFEGEGSSSNYVNRWLQVIVGTGSGFTNYKRLAGAIQRMENKEFDDSMLTLVITERLADINLSSPLHFKIQAAVSGDASPAGKLRHNGISVLASKK
jgi:hypothetical protein